MSTKLGRGLNALIPTGVESTDRATGIITVKIGNIAPNPYQPRHKFDEEKLTDLANSLSESGMIQPIIVIKSNDNNFQLIAGERRLEAAKKAGFTEVPVIIRKATPQEQLQFALIENIQRENLNPIEEALAYNRLQEQFQLTHQEISKMVGKDRATVTNSIRLLKLEGSVQEEIINNRISSGHGRALLQLEETEQPNFAKQIIKGNYSVRETERAIKRYIESKNKVKTVSKDEAREQFISLMETELHSKFQSKVSIKEKNKKGLISFSYKSEKELEKLLTMLLNIDL